MRRKVLNMILAIAVSVVAIFIPSLIWDKWVEGIIFFICHWLIREQFPKQYHHILPATCRLITGVIFFFGVSFILPVSLSLFSAIPINYLVGWVGFTKKQADTFESKYEKLKAKLEEKGKFNTDTCTEEQLVARCRELGMKPENIELAIDLFVKKKSRKELADKYCVEPDSIKQRKRRMKDQLNID